jgi:nucleotide-binding universal stress UspA family protein
MFSLSKILLPVDFSERCLGAARYAIPLAKHFNSEITLLHVLPPYFEFGTAELASPTSKELRVDKQLQARRELDTFLSTDLHDLRVKRLLLEGDPAREIVVCAQSEDSDLIMMPTHGYGPFRRLLLGSVTAKVLHDSNSPIWTGVHMEKAPPFGPIPPHHIVCALDLGPNSSRTLDWAARMASEFKARITLVHVVASLDPRTQDYYLAPEWRGYLIDAARKEIEKIQQRVGTRAEVDLEMGDISKAVCSAAGRLQADLLVIGRGLAEGFVGRLRTHAYAVIREAPCSVVSV